jgi:hypothetical protein
MRRGRRVGVEPCAGRGRRLLAATGIVCGIALLAL